MSVESPVKASWFYLDDDHKTKFNWFLYEYACKLFEYTKDSRKKLVVKWKSQRNDEQIAEFCAYFAKRMRNNISRHLYRDLGGDIVDEEYIHDYCHTNTRRDTDALLEICEAAWLDLLESCAVCPVRCLDEQLFRCEFFDRMERGGYLS